MRIKWLMQLAGTKWERPVSGLGWTGNSWEIKKKEERGSHHEQSMSLSANNDENLTI